MVCWPRLAGARREKPWPGPGLAFLALAFLLALGGLSSRWVISRRGRGRRLWIRLGYARLQVGIQGHQKQSVEGDPQALGLGLGLLIKRVRDTKGEAMDCCHGKMIAWR